MEKTLCKKCNGSGKRQGLEAGTGSMGLGLPMAVGLALAKKLKGEEGKVYCLMSDGELNCGTTWESIQIATHHNLDNLIIIIDENGFQAMGRTQEILQSNFPMMGNSFKEVDGHNYDEIERGLIPYEFQRYPHIMIAKTVKGKGWKRAENNNLYHYKAFDEEEYENAKKELEETKT